MYTSGLIKPKELIQTKTGRFGYRTNPADIRYSPRGLHAMPFIGPACPVSAPTSVQISLAAVPFSGFIHRQRRHPPDHPHANASEPTVVHKPPTNPPRRCPPTSPKRCWFIQSADELPSCPEETETGDQRMREESVEVESSVSLDCPAVGEGRQARDVTPAS